MIVVSVLTSKPSRATVQKYFPQGYRNQSTPKLWNRGEPFGHFITPSRSLIPVQLMTLGGRTPAYQKKVRDSFRNTPRGQAGGFSGAALQREHGIVLNTPGDRSSSSLAGGVLRKAGSESSPSCRRGYLEKEV